MVQQELGLPRDCAAQLATQCQGFLSTLGGDPLRPRSNPQDDTAHVGSAPRMLLLEQFLGQRS